MREPINVVICLGSSCFSRGNKETVGAIQDYLDENKLRSQVRIKGNHCLGKCSDGPVMTVNGEYYYELNPEKAVRILDEILKSPY